MFASLRTDESPFSALEHGEIDLCVGTSRVRDRRIQATRLFARQLVLVVSAIIRWRRAVRSSRADLRKERSCRLDAG